MLIFLYVDCVGATGGGNDPNIDSINANASIGIGSILGLSAKFSILGQFILHLVNDPI